ncbi:DUF2167 domain-containing protein [Chitinophaga silvatica]|uniref:DUF2167 domain-containing protein n=1 Tax=Chitinophaga silvatica TaxID=2282649 RepID=A0A3E1Y8R4_9BACT|nr:DUF2167 domain-containing protein [Chitinophaga silvatica]RFS21795.1 DUF2167 domain-containing protein [Chitinophaga silvatica]
MRKFLYLALITLLCSSVTKATPVKDSTEIFEALYEKYIDSVNNSLHFEKGIIQLAGGKATINIPPGFRFLNSQESEKVLVQIWNNPPDQAKNVLGMIFPENTGPLTDSTYAFVVKFEDLGFIKDDDAEKIDYDEMLKNIHDGEAEENKAREAAGYSRFHLVGWAQKPFYDKEKKVLHWAKEIEFGNGKEVHTLNYNIRILGRHGVLSLNAVCTMEELPLVKANINKVLTMAQFTDGNAYADFDPKVDKIAAWTIGGLVAGKVLAKAGFFVIILKYLGAFWKFILLGIAACFGFIKKLFKRKGSTSEEVVTTGEVPAGEETPASDEASLPSEEKPSTESDNTPPQLPS